MAYLINVQVRLNDRSSESIVEALILVTTPFLLLTNFKGMINYECYTDGAYSSARNQGGIGIVFLRNDVKVAEYSKGFKHTTNNRMEIAAVLATFKAFQQPVDSITIYTDSMYVIGCAALGWKRKKNISLWEQFDKEFGRIRKLCSHFEFKHVKGHAGNKWNSYVDKLAVEASQELL